MAQNFVIALGGSGARTLEAVLYLCASRCITAPVNVLIIDPDQSNGNVIQARGQAERYHGIQRVIEAPRTPDTPRPFFSTPVNPDLETSHFQWGEGSSQKDFGSTIGYDDHQPDKKGLLDLLFDDSDFGLKFDKGYIGRAHIGSIDLLRALTTQIRAAAEAPQGKGDAAQAFFREVKRAAREETDTRVVVVGSVFGGTGASGLPAIPPLLRKHLAEGFRVQIGGVLLAPYFQFPKPGDKTENPDADVHPLVTQASLYHYSLANVGYDRLYLTGAPKPAQTNRSNVAGGEEQKNAAHYTELIAALAIAHFFETPPEHEAELWSAAEESAVVSWNQLPHPVTDDQKRTMNLRGNLVAFATFCLVHARLLSHSLKRGHQLGTKWHADLRKRVGGNLSGEDPRLAELTTFTGRFLKWIAEVQLPEAVDLFELPQDQADEWNETAARQLRDVAKGGTLDRPYHEIVRALNTVHPEQSQAVGWYIDALTQSVDRFCERNYPAFWSRV